jgi:hypothetical protein
LLKVFQTSHAVCHDQMPTKCFTGQLRAGSFSHDWH